jgi:thiosulfate/3-mercaptopyruvate sulfurtransferase
MSSAEFPDSRYLITAPVLASRLNDVTLVDLRPAEDFAVGHIAGSTHVDIYGVSLNDSSEAPLNSFLAIFRVLFGSRGVRADRPVVIYDHESGERSARAVWLLALLGHPDVRILDGGTLAWLAAGHKLVRLTEAPPPMNPTQVPPTPPPFRGHMNLDFLATRFDVFNAINNPEYAIVDVRREAEYRGSEKRARRVGTIPGAVHVFWREHLDAQGAFRRPEEIRALYESRGVTPDKIVIPVCHGGYRSASTFIALKSLGYPQVRNYVSAWGEWGNREDTPVVIPPA